MEEPRELDMKWIEEFEMIDKDYSSFYLEDISNINLTFIYVNKDNDIEKIKEEIFLLNNPNNISREEIVGLLKRNSIVSDKVYTILSILKYNIDIDPSDVPFFLKKNNYENTFIDTIKNIDAIPLKKSISLFHDLNNIIIIFYEKINLQYKDNKNSNHTKRIHMLSNKKKTYRKIV